MTGVTAPDGAVTHYHYGAQSEEDSTTPQSASDPKAVYCYADLSTITDPLGHTYEFTYTLDHTRSSYISNSYGPAGYYPQYGAPRDVTSVILPGSLGTTTFDNSASHVEIQSGWASWASAFLSVTDAASQLTRRYRFANADIIPVPRIPGPGGAGTTFSQVVAYQTLQIDYGTDAGFLGTETFQFDVNAAMALSQATDLSGNTTTFNYETPANKWTSTGDYAHSRRSRAPS